MKPAIVVSRPSITAFCKKFCAEVGSPYPKKTSCIGKGTSIGLSKVCCPVTIPPLASNVCGCPT